MNLPRPWMKEHKPPAIGDFVQVVSGEHQGREGCIISLVQDAQDEYTVRLTSAEDGLPTVVLEDDVETKPMLVSVGSAIRFVRASLILYHKSDDLIMVLPAEVAIHTRIQLFDTVRVLKELFLDLTGYVCRVFDGSGWYMVQTPTHRLRLYRSNIELMDRLCVDDLVRVIFHGAFYGKQGTVTDISESGEISITTIHSNVRSALLV